MPRKAKTNNDFIIEASNIHNDLYDYSKVNYVNATTKVVIICKTHGDFEQLPSNHLKEQGCPKCSGKGKTTEEVITESIKVHGDLYDYSKVNYVNATTKVVIVCKIHGDFKQLLSSHLYGSGCRKCSTIKNSELQRSNKDTFILIANKSHNGLYDYSKVNYVNATTKVVIVCKIHGDFEQSPNNHTHNDRPRGCPLCANIKTSDSQRSNIDIFIKRANEVHGGLYDYSKAEYINCEQKIIIICKAHGEFIQRPQHHLNGTRCPRCNNRGFSKQSIEWLKFINTKDGINIQYIENGNEYLIPNTRYHADGYDPITNTIYEFHGDYWHGNPYLYSEHMFNKTTHCTFGELYKKTQEKKKRCIELGYKYVEIWESDWIRFKNFIRKVQLRFRKRQSNPI